MNKEKMREFIREKYAKAVAGKSTCCSSSCCCGSDDKATTNIITSGLYTSKEVEGFPNDLVNESFGCGNPTAMGALYPCETVLDLGSGAGLDVLLSARRVGPYGKAYGLDMTDEMLAEANANKEKAKVNNAEFLKGHIEEIPLPDKTVDVVISNCVINLSVDKDKVFKEIFRVLKSGGRIAVSDIVTTKVLPDEVRKNLMSWAGCISGALLDKDYEKKLTEAGFENIEIKVTRTYDLTDPAIQQMAPELANEKNSQWNGTLVSAFISAKKPVQQLIKDKDFSIKLAEQNDFVQIHGLLRSKGLPTDGVNPKIGEYYIASNKELMGVIGYETYGTVVLLRSLAVKSQYQKASVARSLIEHMLKILKEMSFTEAYLLTITAEKYLARYGFTKIDRDKVPVNVLETSTLGGACPSSSTCMYLKLQS